MAIVVSGTLVAVVLHIAIVEIYSQQLQSDRSLVYYIARNKNIYVLKFAYRYDRLYYIYFSIYN